MGKEAYPRRQVLKFLTAGGTGVALKALFPSRTRAFTPEIEEGDYIHRVETGDTLWGIAQNYQISLSTIIAANAQVWNNPNLIHPGDGILIPGKDGAVERKGGLSENLLTVERRRSDSLSSIAAFYGVNLETLKLLNLEAKDNFKLPLIDNKHYLPFQQIRIPHGQIPFNMEIVRYFSGWNDSRQYNAAYSLDKPYVFFGHTRSPASDDPGSLPYIGPFVGLRDLKLGDDVIFTREKGEEFSCKVVGRKETNTVQQNERIWRQASSRFIVLETCRVEAAFSGARLAIIITPKFLDAVL